MFWFGITLLTVWIVLYLEVGGPRNITHLILVGIFCLPLGLFAICPSGFFNIMYYLGVFK